MINVKSDVYPAGIVAGAHRTTRSSDGIKTTGVLDNLHANGLQNKKENEKKVV